MNIIMRLHVKPSISFAKATHRGGACRRLHSCCPHLGGGRCAILPTWNVHHGCHGGPLGGRWPARHALAVASPLYPGDRLRRRRGRRARFLTAGGAAAVRLHRLRRAGIRVRLEHRRRGHRGHDRGQVRFGMQAIHREDVVEGLLLPEPLVPRQTLRKRTTQS